MILLSKIIKSFAAKDASDNQRVIALRSIHFEKEAQLPDEEKADERQIIAEAQQLKEMAQAELEKAQMEAAQLKEEAIASREALLQEIEQERLNWENEKKLLIEETRKQAYEEGLLLGKAEGLEQYNDLLKEANQIVELAKQDYEQHLEQAEITILHLAIRSAEKILSHQLAEAPEHFVGIVKGVIKEVKEFDTVQLRVHPTYYEYVMNHKEELQTLLTSPTAAMYVYPDEEMKETSCIVESPFGRIDASIDSQLMELKEKLLEILTKDEEE